ncbi:dmX-like protein 2 isoform X2 [Limulus polyphemus]|uniref:DmX-like protein 2 isoform X2 n=1 Tax=Limulus polyphemus TaxID=6850 RepID=A0ABM1SCZ7_LIMPO|nr:dmX-like protein 2 isoform X2 [Limulus polyphemus]
MNRHQVLTGAVNAGANCYAVGSVEGVPFTAYAAGCNVVILASNFQRVQIIPGVHYGNVQVGCLDCSTDIGKIAAAYGKQVYIFEPTPLLNWNSSHYLDYHWVQTATINAECYVNVLSWNLEGTRLLIGGEIIQLWHLETCTEKDTIEEEGTRFHLGEEEDVLKTDTEECFKWECVWKCRTAHQVRILKFSPDGTLFASAGHSDRLVKVWYESKRVNLTSQMGHSLSGCEVNYTFIYIAHPRAVTGLSWRKTSKYMPRASVANMLVTSCRDNICRLWVQTLLPDDGLINLQQIEALANQAPRLQTQKHRQRIMQRLKHMKSFNQYKKRQASQLTEVLQETIPTLPSTYSVHDFHSFGLHGSGIAPGLHFHLAASINAETDIPLVPSMSRGNGLREPNFVLHWLNNKEFAFSEAAERMLQEVSQKVLQTEGLGSDIEQGESDDQDVQTDSGAKKASPKLAKSRKTTLFGKQQKSFSYNDLNEDVTSKYSFSTLSSSASLATELSSLPMSPLGDALDRKLESLLCEWHKGSDLLFSIHPVDGSFLVWLVDWLDEYSPGSFRQAQVSFSSRIPNAISLGDAATMSHHLTLYSPRAGLDLRVTMQSFYGRGTKDNTSQEPTSKINENKTAKSSKIHVDNEQKGGIGQPDSIFHSPTPTLCMLSKHNNGSLNLWYLVFEEKTAFAQILSISHGKRICGHRFRINDITCHPVLPLLLTTSHHNLPGRNGSGNHSTPVTPSSPDCYPPTGMPQIGFCSELILWKVDPVGPLSKSGGVTELARINSLETAAFANIAWIPTLLPSTTLGSISNSPSACFVASDGQQLRIYQAVIDARTLLAEVSSAERKQRDSDFSMSSSTSSDIGYRQLSLQETFKIISSQSTSRPGCIIELDAISDATHDWKNTQLLHVFQEQLITGDKSMSKHSSKSEGKVMGLVEPSLQAVVDLQHSSVFEEPFYLVVLEKNEEGLSILHMWRLVIASQSIEGDGQNFSYVPDSNLVQDSDHSNHSSRSNTPEPTGGTSFLSPHAQPLRITTKKICTEVLSLPEDVDVIHAAPAAGHLSSSNIYPACFAPYLMSTACSDGKVRFWRCEARETEDLQEPFKYTWLEWEMMLKSTSSAIHVPGIPLIVSCAYSGRIACAYKHGRSFMRPSSENPHGRYVNASVAIFECESTGGSEWVLEDTIHLKNIGLPQPESSLDLDFGSLYSASVRNRRTVETIVQRLGNDDAPFEHAPNLHRLLSVPSFATLHTLRHTITEQGNQSLLTQKSLVQLDWVSTEDGSHLLTVGVGSKILVFTPVSTEISEATAQAMNTHKAGARPTLLKQTSSISMAFHHNEEIRWMRLRTTQLTTTDGLPPLPMQLSWVRDGILVVGMDSEMHIYTQWHQCKNSLDDIKQDKDIYKDTEIVVGSRNLVEEKLLSRARKNSQISFSSSSSSRIPRSISSNILTGGIDSKKKRQAQIKTIPESDSTINDSPLPDFGLFEASQLACPILPQYHPKQLMELLSSGKIHRVKAILSHLVRCLSGTGQMKKDYLQVPDHFENNDTDLRSSPRSWTKSRALSMAPTSPNQWSPMDPQGSVSTYPEEVQLDYVEITSIPPLPLSILLAADREIITRSTPTHTNDGNVKDYSDLFMPDGQEVEDSLDAILNNSFSLGTKKERQKSHEPECQFLTLFDKRQAHLLTKLLTHTHLPGLSSLDQMHLLALADTVSSFNTTLSDRFTFDQEKQAAGNGLVSNKLDGMNLQATTESLDDCGLRFLLAMRHYTYLLRCLPIVQRAQLQRQGLSTDCLVWAFHSETEEELLQFLPCMQRGNPRWCELREVGVGWWVKSNNTLRRLVEKVAKCAFQSRNDPLDAALFYLAMRKKNIVWGLFRSVSDQKMTAFFQNNFAEDRWRKSALKNAFALLGKQRFEHAAAFFLLAGAIRDAIEVCLNKLNDLQLAMVIVRLYEGDLEITSTNLRRLIYEEILGYDAEGNNYSMPHAHPDPFLRSMAHWLLQDYSGALNTLLQTGVGQSHLRIQEDDEKSSNKLSANPSVFNFYLYLRTHPLIVRRQLAQTAQDKKKVHSLMLSSFKYSMDPVDQKSALQATCDIITPLERRLFFTSANYHFRAGCPALALEVLSRLPDRVAVNISVFEEGVPPSPDPLLQFKSKNMNSIKSGTLDGPKVIENGEQFDWSTPIVSSLTLNEPPSFNVMNDSEESSDEEEGISLKFKVYNDEEKATTSEEIKKDTKLDIMAQQLKFIACLKIMMEELSTLATGFEVDGGQLRYQLYTWLEKGVAALRELCHYGSSSFSSSSVSSGENVTVVNIGEKKLSSTLSGRWDADTRGENRPTLHEILQADKQDFEAKLMHSYKRKQWLKANEALLRTLLSYCSLHGAHGGGLAAVRMELSLLLQELQQDRSQQQLLSPLPFPTTLPLLAATIACQKTVIADPICHLQAMIHDILQSITEIGYSLLVSRGNFNEVNVLRGLGTALAACIYQSLCDSDNFNVKQEGSSFVSEGLMSSSVVYQNSHLLAGYLRRHRYCSEGSDLLIPNTVPSKWPGVQSLRALLARDKDEDSPKLHTLLCEAFFAVYLSLLVYGIATCDGQILYRLVGQNLSEKTWAMLYGGGAKRLLHVVTGGQHPLSSSSEKSTPGEEGLLITLSKQRMKLHRKLLGQLGQSTAQKTMKEDRPTYREQFVPPEMSMVSYLMSKPELSEQNQAIDYDSSESVPSDVDEEEEDEVDADDVFSDFSENTKDAKIHSKKTVETSKIDELDPDSYSWGILRYAVVKLVHCHVLTFLGIAGIDLQELPVSSPMIHSILKTLELWLYQLKTHMESYHSPPPNYLPGCFVESIQSGPAIHKYKALHELHNTPFRSHSAAVRPVKRLWNFLVRQEPVQDIFIRYIFSRRHAHVKEDNIGQDTDSMDYSNPDPVRIIHKDQDSITTFCVSKINAGIIALATPKEIQELDFSLLLEPTPWLEDEAEFDILNLEKTQELPESEFLVVHHPSDRGSSSCGYGVTSGAPNSVAGSSYSSPTGPAPPLVGIQTGRGTSMLKGHHFPGSYNPQFCQFVIERSRHLLKPLKRHKMDGVRKMCAHPFLPLYLSGSQDGSLQMWKWGHQQGISSPRPPGTYAKVTNMLFNVQGNKFGVTDGDGNLSLWQVGLSTVMDKPFFSAQCHSKEVSDFTFVSSSSLLATAGHSAENKNVCLWDTLVPIRKAMVSAFMCHEQGSSAIVYAPQHQVLISAGKKGDVCIFDVRQRQLRHKFQAHDSPIKCLALDPGEEFFVTGSADGDMKVWGLSVHILFYSFLGEHSRSTLFRNIGMGVSQIYVDSSTRLFSCGADGSMKLRQLPDRNSIVSLYN